MASSECRNFFDCCYYCRKPNLPSRKPGLPGQPLKRCGGCQLVAYCGRDCQKDDRLYHKGMCKAFPVVNGKNVLHTTGNWIEHIAGLRKRASRLSTYGSPPLFVNPRVCNTCQEAQPDLLKDCECGGVCYCSKKCTKADKSHGIEECTILQDLARSYNVKNMYCSYPMSLKYVLEALPKHIFGRDIIPLEDRITLSVHIISNIGVSDSSIPWEGAFMHKLPKLKQLKLDFIMQEKRFKTPIEYINCVSPQRCKDCEAKDRITTYAVHQMPYHMFFSSLKYTEPDIVVIYGNQMEMLMANADGDIQTDISYRNMTNNLDTVLVLMDHTEALLREGYNMVHSAQPIHTLISPHIQINKNRGYASLAGRLDSDGAFVNERYYFTCLRKQE